MNELLLILYIIPTMRCVVFGIILKSKYGKNPYDNRAYRIILLGLVPGINIFVAIFLWGVSPWHHLGMINLDIDIDNFFKRLKKH